MYYKNALVLYIWGVILVSSSILAVLFKTILSQRTIFRKHSFLLPQTRDSRVLGHLQELRKISTKFLNICRNYRLYLLATLNDFDFKRNLRANSCNDKFNEDFVALHSMLHASRLAAILYA